MHRSTPWLAAAALLATACTAGTFQPGRTVDVQKRALGHAYTQDGKPVNVNLLMDELQKSEATRGDASSARAWGLAGNTFAGAGGALIGYGLVSGGDDGLTLAAVGAGGAVIGLVMAGTADRKLARAVDVYNQRLGGAPSARLPAALPWIAAVPESSGRCSAVAGVQLSF